MEVSNSLFRLDMSHVEQAVDVVSRAFFNDPVTVYIVPDESKRSKLLPLYRFIIRYGILSGEVYSPSSKIEGLAVWFRPLEVEMSLINTIRAGGWRLLFFGFGLLSRYFPVTAFLNEVHKRCAPFPHWYLSSFCVDPPYQGRGLGSALLRPMLERIEREGWPCYLETNTEKNVSIYQHFGFKIIDESKIPDTDITNWAMLKSKSE